MSEPTADRSKIQPTGIAGLRAALAEVPDDTEIIVLDERGGVYRLREVAGTSGPDGTLMVISLVKVGQDPSMDGWTGVEDLATMAEEVNPMDNPVRATDEEPGR